MSSAYLTAPTDEPLKDFEVILNRGAYTLRCIACVFKRSKEKIDENTGEKSGNNPMLERTWEVISPEVIKCKNALTGELEEKNIAGLQVRDWLTMTSRTGKIVKADSVRLGVEPPDDEKPNVMAYIGKTARAKLMTKTEFDMDENTGAFIMIGDKQKIVYRHSIVEWLG